MSTKIHAFWPLPALAASAVKELRDLIVGAFKWKLMSTIKDAAEDFAANAYGIAAASDFDKSCEERCAECPTRR